MAGSFSRFKGKFTGTRLDLGKKVFSNMVSIDSTDVPRFFPQINPLTIWPRLPPNKTIWLQFSEEPTSHAAAGHQLVLVDPVLGPKAMSMASLF